MISIFDAFCMLKTWLYNRPLSRFWIIMLNNVPGYSNVPMTLTFNVKKCHCIAFGKNAAWSIDPMNISSCKIDWYDFIKYLGVYIVAGKGLLFNLDPVKRKFYAACISHGRDSAFVVARNLLPTYFTVCFTRLYLQKKRQLSELNVCWNCTFGIILNFNQWMV